MSYADRWNDAWKGPRASGPVVMLVDGIHEERMQEMDGMEVDGTDFVADPLSLLEDIRVERQQRTSHTTAAQNSELLSAMEFDTSSLSNPRAGGAAQLLIVDTNVLVGRLTLLKELVDYLLLDPSANLVLCIPGIVVQELDGLRSSTRTNNAVLPDGNVYPVSVSRLARQANDWLLSNFNNKWPCVRGQKTHESPRGDWRYNRDYLQNDDLIFEYATYCVQNYQFQPADIKILTNDKNLQLKFNMEGFSFIAPGSGQDLQQILNQVLASEVSPNVKRRADVDWAKSAPSRRRTFGGAVQVHDNAKSSSTSPMPPIAARMLEDRDDLPLRPPHPLSALHDQIRSFLASRLPELVQEAVAQLQFNRNKLDRENRNLSIHARKVDPLAKVDLPDEADWRQWTLQETISWLDKVLQPVSGLPKNASTKLSSFLTPYDERGGRKGEAWGRGDWSEAIDAIKRYDPVASEAITVAWNQCYG